MSLSQSIIFTALCVVTTENYMRALCVVVAGGLCVVIAKNYMHALCLLIAENYMHVLCVVILAVCRFRLKLYARAMCHYP